MEAVTMSTLPGLLATHEDRARDDPVVNALCAGVSDYSTSAAPAFPHMSVAASVLRNVCEMLLQRGYEIQSVLDEHFNVKPKDFMPCRHEVFHVIDEFVSRRRAECDGWDFRSSGPAVVAEVPPASERCTGSMLGARKDLRGSEQLHVYFSASTGQSTSVSVDDARSLAGDILRKEHEAEDPEPRPHRVMFVTPRGTTASASEPLLDLGVEVETWKFTQLLRNPSRHMLWTHFVVLVDDWSTQINADVTGGIFLPGRGPVDPMTRYRVDPLDLPVVLPDDVAVRFYGLASGMVVCRVALAGFAQGFFQLRRVPDFAIDRHREFLRRKRQTK